MGFFTWLRRLWDYDAYRGGAHNHEINPATGLPMVGGIDVAGNPYGVADSASTPDLPPSSLFDHQHDHDWHDHDWHHHHSSWDDIHNTNPNDSWSSTASHESYRSSDY